MPATYAGLASASTPSTEPTPASRQPAAPPRAARRVSPAIAGPLPPVPPTHRPVGRDALPPMLGTPWFSCPTIGRTAVDLSPAGAGPVAVGVPRRAPCRPSQPALGPAVRR